MDFALNQQTNDLDVVNNSLYFVTGNAAISQEIFIRFNGFYGEWFLDTTLFMPWFQDILIKAPNFAVVNELCKNCILDTPGVIGLQSYNLAPSNLSTRAYLLQFVAITSTGVIDFSQEIELPSVDQVTVSQ